MRKSYQKYTIIFSILTASAFIICWGVNALLLSSFYESKMQNRIEQIYAQLNSAIINYGIDSEEFDDTFLIDSEDFGCDILILDSNMEVYETNTPDVKFAKQRLWENINNKGKEIDRLLRITDEYSMVVAQGKRTEAEYIELSGTLANGYPILIRAAVNGMHENAKVATVFFAYVGMAAIFISFILVLFISKNMTLRAELKKRMEMDDMRKEFISNVSHELKTPIAIIQGYAEGLSDCVNDDDESREFYCEVITDEAKKMNRLVQNLLELNKLEFGQNIATFEVFNITELINNCIRSSDILIKQNEIEMVFDGKKDVFINADEFMIEQVFNNYLSNAIHYADGENKQIKVSITEKSDVARVTVFNSGEHIPDAAIQKIWTKFYKVDKARTRSYGGSGVGLSIVKASMEAMDQKYGVKNVDGGVEFFFEAQIKKV